MPAKKKTHAADLADMEAIGRATSFNVHQRRSPSAKRNVPAETMAQAADIADKLTAECPNRPAVVYAITEGGETIAVPKEMLTAARAAMFDDDAKPAREAAPAPVRKGKRAAALEAAERGEMPTPPDFSAATHAPYRKRLDEIVALAVAGEADALRAIEIKTYSTSPRALARYRDLAVIAIEARGGATGRPGDMAAIHAEEAGISYGDALVACNMD